MSNKLKILVSSSIFPNNIEITKGIYIFHQVKALSKYCEIKVIAPIPYFPSWIKSKTYSFYSRIKKKEMIDGVEVFHPRVFFTPKVGRVFYGFFYALSLYRITKKLKRRMDPDIMLCFWVYPDGFANVLLSKLLKLPLILGGRGCDINNLGESLTKKLMVEWALKKSNRVLSVSNAMKREMINLHVPDKKIGVIPNGLNSIFRPMNKKEARKFLNIREELPERKIILFCGRFSPEKGLEYLIKAAKILKNKNEKFNILLVGDGPQKEELIGLVDHLGLSRIVYFMDQVSHKKVPILLNACDIFCLPSIREGWPNVIMEALACRLPVVASKVGGVPEIITSQEYGIMVPPKNIKALANSLGLALEKSWDYDKIGFAVENSTWDNVAQKIIGEIDMVLN